MKKLLIICTVVFIAVAGCRYEEGPKVSFNSVKNRLTGEWFIDEIKVKNVDKTADYKIAFVNYKLTIKKDGKYTLFYRPFNITDYNEEGVWTLSDDKLKVSFLVSKGNNPGEKSTFNIQRLTNKQLWAIHINGNGDEEYIKLKP